MERNLTSEEISIINKEFRTNPNYRIYNLRKLYREDFPMTEILSVSNKNDLIMIKGNSDTGYDHIRERHSFYTTKIYTKTKGSENLEKSFTKPSCFSPNTAPIDYIKIADDIYNPDNRIVDNQNEGAEYFDLYIANVIFPDSEKVEPVKLLIYKDTKIIHTMYPQRDTFSRKIKQLNNFPFRRGVVEVKYLSNDLFIRINIPYENVENQLWYGINIDKDFRTNIEKWYILVFHGDCISKYSIDIIEQPVRQYPFYKSKFQHGDLREIEKIIKDIDDQFNSGTIILPNKNN
jgi:hypothetical protein